MDSHHTLLSAPASWEEHSLFPRHTGHLWTWCLCSGCPSALNSPLTLIKIHGNLHHVRQTRSPLRGWLWFLGWTQSLLPQHFRVTLFLFLSFFFVFLDTAITSHITEPLERKGKVLSISILFLFLCFCFLGLYPWHLEVPRVGVESELQLQAYSTVTAMQDPRRICDLHHISRQCRILNPLGKARDQTHILRDTSWVRYHWATMGTLNFILLSIVDLQCCVNLPSFILKRGMVRSSSFPNSPHDFDLVFCLPLSCLRICLITVDAHR